MGTASKSSILKLKLPCSPYMVCVPKPSGGLSLKRYISSILASSPGMAVSCLCGGKLDQPPGLLNVSPTTSLVAGSSGPVMSTTFLSQMSLPTVFSRILSEGTKKALPFSSVLALHRASSVLADAVMTAFASLGRHTAEAGDQNTSFLSRWEG